MNFISIQNNISKRLPTSTGGERKPVAATVYPTFSALMSTKHFEMVKERTTGII
jgi:hypothetical protein